MAGGIRLGGAAGRVRGKGGVLLLLVFLLGAGAGPRAQEAPASSDRVRRAEELLLEDDSVLARWRSLVFALIQRDGPGDRRGAVRMAAEASRRFRDSSEAWSLHARTLLYQGRFQEASDAARKALSIREGNAEAHLVLGEVLLGQGRLDAARDALQESARLAPNLPEPHALLAALYERRKLYPLAADSWEAYRRRRSGDGSAPSGGEGEDEGRIALLRAMGPRTPFSIEGDAVSTTVPMVRSRGGIYLVRVKPRRGRWEWFDIDSGSDGVLISRALRRRLGLREVSETSVTGIGGNVVPARTAVLDSLTLGGFTLRNIPVEVLDRFSRHEGRPIAGSLGQRFLREFVVTMNFPAGTLTLELPRRRQFLEPGPAGGARPRVKYSVPMRYPSITLGEWNGEGRIPLLWDTGAGLSLFDSRLLREPDPSGEPGGDRKRGKDGTGGLISYRKMDSSSWVRVDGYQFRVEPAVMDLGPLNRRTSYLGGIIGTDVMKDYIVTFDYFRGELRLQRVNAPSPGTAGPRGGG